MEYLQLTKDILETLAIPFTIFFAAYKMHQNWQAKFVTIGQKNQDRYNRLNESKGELYKYFKMKDFTMDKIEEKDKHSLSSLMHRFFWYFFNMWVEGHNRKTLPRYLKRDWDIAIKNSMQKAIFREFWKNEFRHESFLDKPEFNRFIEKLFLRNSGK